MYKTGRGYSFHCNVFDGNYSKQSSVFMILEPFDIFFIKYKILEIDKLQVFVKKILIELFI